MGKLDEDSRNILQGMFWTMPGEELNLKEMDKAVLITKIARLEKIVKSQKAEIVRIDTIMPEDMKKLVRIKAIAEEIEVVYNPCDDCTFEKCMREKCPDYLESIVFRIKDAIGSKKTR